MGGYCGRSLLAKVEPNGKNGPAAQLRAQVVLHVEINLGRTSDAELDRSPSTRRPKVLGSRPIGADQRRKASSPKTRPPNESSKRT